MKNAYRGHYQPACNELVPWADPYIAALVARSLGQPGPTGGEVISSCCDAAHEVAPARVMNYRNAPSERAHAPRRLHTGHSSLAAMSHGW